VSALDGELLVYDGTAFRAHCLDATARAVFERCDGRTSLTRIAEAIGGASSQPIVELALDELLRAALIERPAPRTVDHARRRALREVAVLGGLSVALPMVWSVVAPAQAEAASSIICIPPAACMGVSSTTCCGTSGSAGMSCSGGAGMCMGSGAACVGTCS